MVFIFEFADLRIKSGLFADTVTDKKYYDKKMERIDIMV